MDDPLSMTTKGRKVEAVASRVARPPPQDAPYWEEEDFGGGDGGGGAPLRRTTSQKMRRMSKGKETRQRKQTMTMARRRCWEAPPFLSVVSWRGNLWRSRAVFGGVWQTKEEVERRRRKRRESRRGVRRRSFARRSLDDRPSCGWQEVHHSTTWHSTRRRRTMRVSILPPPPPPRRRAFPGKTTRDRALVGTTMMSQGSLW